MVVLLLPARSAEPPQNSGSVFASAAITSPDAFRVATSLPAGYCGRSASQPLGRSPLTKRFNNVARSGLALFQDANFSSQAFREAAPLVLTSRTWARISAGIAKCSSGSKPSNFFVSAISSAPRAEPWDSAVFRALGAGQAIIDCMRISVGLIVSFLAAIIAASTAVRSTSPSLAAATSMTFQPYAR